MKNFLILFLSFSHLLAFAEPESVIGEDSRVQIQINDKNHIYNKIGLLEIENYSCTGTLIGPTTVITAAHCVVDETKNAFMDVSSIRFYPGKKNSSHAPYGAFKAKQVITFKEYVETQDSEYDVALIELQKSPGLGYLPITSLSANSLSGKTITIAGYAGDKAYGTLWEAKGASSVGLFAGNIMRHSADTYNGESGAVVRMKIGGVEKIVGIHSTGGTYSNGAIRINSEILSAINRWKAKLK